METILLFMKTIQYIASSSFALIICSFSTVWDKKMVHTQFNWCWYHVPTFAPYKAEGVFFPLILASGTAAQCARTATLVLQSLTPNAQSVFKVLAEYQLANEKEEGEYLLSFCSLHVKFHHYFFFS